LLVADWVVADCELEHPVEDQTAAAGAAAVEPEAELVEVARKVLDAHRALMGGQQPPFGQRRDAVHARQQGADVLAQGLGGALTAPIMGVADLVDARAC
jgi:hypothetical protein